jgi:NADH:ubiquinone oxidoreductase subunit 6 (subunit J)
MPQILFLDALAFRIGLPAALGLIAVFILLPRPRGYPALWGAAIAAGALLLAGILLVQGGVANAETILFYAFSAIAIASGGLLVTQRNPVHAALSFALVVLSTCGLFLLQAAPFLMAATIIIYAGAIIVTFLFVIMLAQQAGLSDADARSREPLLSCVAGFVLLGVLLYVLHRDYENAAAPEGLLLAPYEEDRLKLLVERITAASEKNTVEQINQTLGPDTLEGLSLVAVTVRGSPEGADLGRKLRDLDPDWTNWKMSGQVAPMQAKLIELAQAGKRVEDAHQNGRARMPAENVAYLGRTLFIDYLLPVELGGTLLLAATIGAIAIAGRRPEGLR